MCIRFSTGKKKKMRANTDQGLKNCPKDMALCFLFYMYYLFLNMYHRASTEELLFIINVFQAWYFNPFIITIRYYLI